MPPVGLFGVLTYDPDLPVSPDKPTAVFLNVANQHHVGPNRLWVELARQWAGAGVRSLRLDLSGLGDSPDRHGAGGRWECFKPEAFDDVVDAVRWASPDDPSNVVLVGLCSGGYQALESALAVGARGVVAINPFVSFEPAEVRAGLPPDPRRRIPVPDDELDDDARPIARGPIAPGPRWPGQPAPSHRPGAVRANGSVTSCNRARTPCWSVATPSSGRSAERCRRHGCTG